MTGGVAELDDVAVAGKTADVAERANGDVIDFHAEIKSAIRVFSIACCCHSVFRVLGCGLNSVNRIR